MAAVRNALSSGKSAIILVPEIALTPQMVSWFRGRFGPVAAVIHSRLSAGERYDEWRRIRRGEARVVIGARSAVFSPVKNLGMIVIDEEHESTYLNDRHPRYDTREVAANRCEREGAVLVLASATPSILSFAKARRGDYMLLEMPDRVNERPLPDVEIADMRSELEGGNRSVLSGVLKKALKECCSQFIRILPELRICGKMPELRYQHDLPYRQPGRTPPMPLLWLYYGSAIGMPQLRRTLYPVFRCWDAESGGRSPENPARNTDGADGL